MYMYIKRGDLQTTRLGKPNGNCIALIGFLHGKAKRKKKKQHYIILLWCEHCLGPAATLCGCVTYVAPPNNNIRLV